MALAANEVQSRGFAVDRDSDALVVTSNPAGARMVAGYLRDTDRRLVVTRA
jgi:hypothetical protein